MNTTLPPTALWERTAEDVMTPNPVSIRDDASLEEAIVFLIDKGFRAAPVIDATGRPVGVISQSDIVIHERESVPARMHDFYRTSEEWPAAAAPIKFVSASRVRDVMTPVVFQVRPDAPFARALEEMVALGVHRLFVVDENNILVGVITALDMLRTLYHEMRGENADLMA